MRMLKVECMRLLDIKFQYNTVFTGEEEINELEGILVLFSLNKIKGELFIETDEPLELSQIEEAILNELSER